MNDPTRLTATEARRRMAAGRLDPRTYLAAHLDRIAARDRRIRAFAWHDRDAVRPGGAGALAGLPVGVKDVLDTAEFPSQYGSPIWAGHRPRADAACVAAMRAAGGIVVGKTVTTEFATRHPGPTANPHDVAHTPGGSSSGSAAGVADFQFPLAFGTQTAGSIIRPAAYCGIVGYKPSHGLIPRLGMKVMSETLDTIGVMARSVADCALFAGAVAEVEVGDPDTRPGRAPRIGLCRSPAWPMAAPETGALWDRVGTALGAAGAILLPRELPETVAAVVEAHPVVMNGESAQSMGWELAHAAPLLSPGLREALAAGRAAQGAPLAAARAALAAARTAFPSVLEGLDVLLTPSAPGEAPRGLDWTGDPAFNRIWTALHVPCVTVPAGSGPSGLPLGIQVVGRVGEDRAVLAWAAWVAAALG